MTTITEDGEYVLEEINPGNAEAKALNRIAVALEQLVLAILDRPTAATGQQVASQPALTALPPVNGGCPIHGTPWKVVPAGISKKTGNAYEAFRACSTTGCDQRPPR